MTLPFLHTIQPRWLWMTAGLIALGLVTVIWLSTNYLTVYTVFADDQKLGDVLDPLAVNQQYDELKANLKQGAEQLTLVDQPTLRFESAQKWFPKDETQAVVEKLKSQMKELVFATELQIEGKPEVTVANEQVAKQVLDRLKSAQSGDGASNISIVENVSFKNVQVSADRVSTADKAYERLTRVTKPAVRYTVEDGDTLWDISLRLKVSFDELLTMNQQMGDVLKAGQTVIVSPEKRVLNVRSEKTYSERRDIPFQTVYKTDNGSQKVQDQDGKPGIKEVSYLITMENGLEVARTVTAENVVQEPVDRIKVKRAIVKVASAQSNIKEQSTDGAAFLWPTDGRKISSGYGYRGNEFHQGLDIARSGSLDIKAAAAGKIAFAGWKGDYGNLIIISHGNGLATYYAHNKELLVANGDYVNAGDSIAVMGTTGQSTGVHLHFEVRNGGRTVNPIPYLKGS